MNILAIPTTYGLSKPICGGQNRFCNLVGQLKEKGNNIFVLESRDFIDSNDKKLAKIYFYTDYKLFNRTLTIFRDLNIDYILKILKIIKKERIDLIQITHPSGIWAAKLIIRLLRKKIPIVYDAHNVESNFIMETFANNLAYSRLERLIIPLYTKFLERTICKYVHIISVSSEEKNTFVKRYKLKKEKVTVIPSGCHLLELPDKNYKNDVKEGFGINSDKLIVFFHGLFSHPPNKEAFEKIESYIAPRFKKINERALFVLAGTKLPRFKRENILSLGFVKDLYKILSVADIAIVPLTRGAGTKLKILDYLCMGLPIVTTKKGIEGIDAKNYEHAIIVSDVNEEFINAIEYLIENEDERKRLGRNARKLAEKKYDWNKIGKKLDKLYRRLLDEENEVE